MINELRFAFYAIKKNIQNSSELRASFISIIFGMTISNVAFIILWVFFVKSVGVINGWTAADIVGLLGFSTLCFGIVFSAGMGIMSLPQYVASGAFDRFMLSPKNLLIRVATSVFGTASVGDLVFGITCLTIYGFLIDVNAHQVFLILLLIVVATTVFFSAAIAVYSASFLFTDAGSVTGGLFELFLTPSLFHGGAFQGAVRFFFTFFVPSLLVGTLPVEIVRDISLHKLALVCALAFAWFFLSIWLFSAGVKKYESSNFMTFGV